ncbi:MAG: glycosyltransferase family 2 protein [Candidatus Omnitrophica bacterium]|nr:glycosyltransferase family 2 protein [Candidatus Omnitrophota bacterium]
MKLPISTIIITHNEEKNVKACLDSVAGWADEILVIDSGSTDSTREIAHLYTDKIYEHPFENYARQRSWAQNSLPIRNEWVFHLDADEQVSPELLSEFCETFRYGPRVDGYMMPRKTIFRGRWIKHGGHYPSYHLRLFKKDKGGSEERFYDQHYIVNGRTAMLKGDIVNTVTPDIKALIAKCKVVLEAREILYNDKRTLNIKLNGTPIERMNWLRYKIYYRAPLFIRPILYFLYRYFLRLGFMDGEKGLIFHFYQGFLLRFLIDMEIMKLKTLKK